MSDIGILLMVFGLCFFVMILMLAIDLLSKVSKENEKDDTRMEQTWPAPQNTESNCTDIETVD